MSIPPSYKDLTNVVNDYLTKGSEVRGISLDAKEDGDLDAVNVFPFAQKGLVGAHLVYNNSRFNTSVASRVAYDFRDWRQFLPTVTYRTKINNTADTIEVNASAGTVKVSAEHPVANVTCKTALLDGLASEVAATTCVAAETYAGAALSYDPQRSGVRDFTAAVVRYNCPNIYRGDILAKFTLRYGFGLHLRIPLHQYADVAIAAERQRFIAGVQGRSPCGARVMLNANVTDGTFTATTIRNFNDMWKFTVTMTAPFSKSGNAVAPQYGFKLTHMDATD